MIHRVHIIAAVFFVGLVQASLLAQIAQPPFSNAPKLKLLLEDRFKKDTRGNYQIEDATAICWDAGRLVLPNSSKLRKKVSAGPQVEVEIDLEFPSLAKEGDKSEVKVWLSLAGPTDCFVWLRQKRTKDSVRSAIFIADSEGDWGEDKNSTPVRSPLIILNELPSGKWKIGYRHGVVSVSSPKNQHSVFGYIKNDNASVSGVGLDVPSGSSPLQLSGLRVESTPTEFVSDVGGKDLTEAMKLDIQVFRLYQARRYQEALPLAEKSLGIREKHLGAYHSDTRLCLINLAAQHRALRNIDKAVSLYLKLQEVMEKNLGPNHPELVSLLDKLAGAFNLSGETEKVEPLLIRKMKISEKLYGASHPIYADHLLGLGHFYKNQDEYTKAEPIYLEVQRILERTTGKNNPQYAVILNNLGLLYSNMADLEKASALLAEAAVVMSESAGTNDTRYAMILSSLGMTYGKMGQLKLAEENCLKAVQIFQKTTRGESVNLAKAYDRLGSLYTSMNELEKAEKNFQLALKMGGKVFREADGNYLNILNNFGEFYAKTNQLEKAENLIQKSVRIKAAALGKEHSQSIAGFTNLAVLKYIQGDFADAAEKVKQILDTSDRNSERYAVIQSEAQQRKYLSLGNDRLGLFLSLAHHLTDRQNDVFEAVVVQKGSVLARQKSYRMLADNAVTRGQFDALRKTVSQLSKHAQRNTNSPGWDRRNRKLEEEFESLEKAIAKESALFRQTREAVNAGEFSKSLPPGSALVVYVKYDNWIPRIENDRTSIDHVPHLAALIARPDATADSNVVLLDLGRLDLIEDEITRWRRPIEVANQNGRPINAAEELEMDSSGANLKKMIWSPVEKHLGNDEMVIISPDGPLGRFPLTALPGRKPGSYLIEERKLVCVAVPRLLPQMLKQSVVKLSDRSKTLLVGDIDYGVVSDSTESDLALATRGDVSTRKMNFSTLKNTGKEIREIAQLFIESTVLANDSASERQFKNLASRHSILHIATHGFFNPLSPTNRADPGARAGKRDLDFSAVKTSEVDNPLLRSGLAFANANNALNVGVDSDKEDGILFSAEIAMQPMENVELAVLSACETSLGTDGTPGEGLIGIQRAFQIAGAKSTIASYWKVDDEATRILMSQFYKNLMSKTELGRNGNSATVRLDALRDAQLWMLNNPVIASATNRGQPIQLDPKKIQKSPNVKPTNQQKRTHPRYWAAFILSGDWR